MEERSFSVVGQFWLFCVVILPPSYLFLMGLFTFLSGQMGEVLNFMNLSGATIINHFVFSKIPGPWQIHLTPNQFHGSLALTQSMSEVWAGFPSSPQISDFCRASLSGWELEGGEHRAHRGCCHYFSVLLPSNGQVTSFSGYFGHLCSGVFFSSIA